jgi:hypothetical protein
MFEIFDEISSPIILYKTFPFLRYRIKCFASDKIPAQVSSLLSRSELIAELVFKQLTDIPSSVPQM